MPRNTNRYKGLNFPKDNLESSIQEFCESNGITFNKLPKSDNRSEWYELTIKGADKGLLQIYHLNNGKTTFNPKVGKNQALSIKLAEYLITKVDHSKGQVTSVLMGYSLEEIEPLIELMLDKKHSSGKNLFEFVKREISGGFRFYIQNSFYKDKLTVSIYKTGRLVIQGLPLSCHNEFIFQMSVVLDAEGLAKVISKNDENTIQLVEKHVIEDNLSSIFKGCFQHIPQAVRIMLVTGSTLRSIEVELPDYTCVLFPDLRALEGVIKNIFFIKDIEYRDTLGELFEYNSPHNYTLKSEIQRKFTTKMIAALSDAYNFYHRHRHGLFHMNNDVNSSRTITTLDKAEDLAGDIYVKIRNIYELLP